MTIYVVQTYYYEPPTKAFTCKLMAIAYKDEIDASRKGVMVPSLDEYELVTDQFMEQILQPKESHETNTNSSL